MPVRLVLRHDSGRGEQDVADGLAAPGCYEGRLRFRRRVGKKIGDELGFIAPPKRAALDIEHGIEIGVSRSNDFEPFGPS